MESPIKINEEIKKAKEAKPAVASVVPSSVASPVLKMIVIFGTMVLIIVILFLYFLGGSFQETQQIPEVKNKNSNVDSTGGVADEFKGSGSKRIFYNNRGFGFQLAFDEKRSNYKAVVKENQVGPWNSDLVIYFPVSSGGAGSSEITGYEKVFGLHIYTKKAWSDYETNCSKAGSCNEIKIGENDVYVFAISKDDENNSAEIKAILESLKTINPDQIDEGNPSGNNNNSNDNTDKGSKKGNSNSNQGTNDNGEVSDNLNNANKNVVRKENCSYPSGNIATWWSTATEKERICFINEHGTPDFGNEEPYFCDYADSTYCLQTK